MAVNLIDKIKPKNGGTFALVDAADVEMPDGKRLSDVSMLTEEQVNALIDEKLGVIENGTY